MVIDIDEEVAVLHALADLAQALETGGVGRDHAVEAMSGSGRLNQVAGVEEGELLGHVVFVPADDLSALALQRQCEAELRADAIAVGTDVAGDTNGFAVADPCQDPVNDLRMGLHEGD